MASEKSWPFLLLLLDTWHTPDSRAWSLEHLPDRRPSLDVRHTQQIRKGHSYSSWLESSSITTHTFLIFYMSLDKFWYNHSIKIWNILHLTLIPVASSYRNKLTAVFTIPLLFIDFSFAAEKDILRIAGWHWRKIGQMIYVCKNILTF